MWLLTFNPGSPMAPGSPSAPGPPYRGTVSKIHVYVGKRSTAKPFFFTIYCSNIRDCFKRITSGPCSPSGPASPGGPLGPCKRE